MANIDPRAGAPKRTTEAQPVWGQTRREDRGQHPLAGPTAKRPLDDLPLQKNWSGRQVPVHSGMTELQRTENFTSSTARDVLTDAKNLGRKA